MHFSTKSYMKNVYMQLPSEVTTDKTNQVYKLIKFLYGLKHAKRQWHEKLLSTLLGFEFQQAISDHSIFIKHKPSSFTALAIYVNDVIQVETI